MLFEHQDYREYLKAVLVSRQLKNSRYSLRAFAKSLSISPGALSKILNSINNLSSQKALEFAQHLKLSEKETDYFLHLVTLNNLNRKVERNDPVQEPRLFKELSDLADLILLPAEL